MSDQTLPDGLNIREKNYRDFSAAADDVRLRRPERESSLRLVLNGETRRVSRVANAFPLSASSPVVAFFDTEGEEIGIMRQPDALDQQSHRVLQEELEKSYFMPRIVQIIDIEEEMGVESWDVVTDKGERSFEVRDPRRNVRKISGRRVIIKDVDGNRYEVKDWTGLDRDSLQLLTKHL